MQPLRLSSSTPIQTLACVIYAVDQIGDVEGQTRPVAFDLHKFLRKQLTLKAGSTLSRHHALEVAVEHLNANDFLPERYVTHVFDVEYVQGAYDTAILPAQGRLKVAVRMA
jgi:L-iditol 2-dehydrogenase